MNQPKLDVRVPLREDGAEKVLARVEDPITRNLVRLGRAAGRMRFMRTNDFSDAEWEARLPTAPFDLEFFASVLVEVFSNHELLERILSGESIAAATGWDV